MKGMKNALLVSFVVATVNLFSGCENEEGHDSELINSTTEKVDTQSLKSIETKFTTVDLSNLGEGLDIFDRKNNPQYELSDPADWVSISGQEKITVDGKGPFGTEEGIATIVLKDDVEKTTVTYSLNDKYDRGTQHTPKEVEGIDDTHVFVTIGHGYGTVSNGGDLYVLNLETNKAYPVTLTKQKGDVLDIRSNPDGSFTYFEYVYDDENFEEGHYEEGRIILEQNK
ncbi:DUF4652 domain-containing protein [Bacillus massiliigorillae]|uniref:DUF4652 domain-containing protein n=1 Tax=Bacillus massiliigorillae TaxID=1243664 RepID=UPI0003AAA4CD|nr:DUF4652 domain-containing protein [Bacillus massiliigorillae]